MIARLVPPTVTAVTTSTDRPHAALYAEEERSLGSATAGRRLEFTTARACAHEALGQIGESPAPIASGPRGEPLWPAGVTGSITHCARYRACAVALQRDVRAVGIDAEVHAPLPDGILDTVASPRERRQLAEHGHGVCWDRLLFSAKEAVFKAWYPLTGRELRFEDVELRIQPGDGTFTVRLLVDDVRVPTRLQGRWHVEDGIVATAVVVGTAS